jgi:hypothetical protein
MRPARAPETRSDSPLGIRAQDPGNACDQWSALTRIGFRFAFIYFGLCNLETLLHLLAFPPFIQLSRFYEAMRWYSVLWVSKHVLHASHDFGIDFHNLASGTRNGTYAWVQALCFLTVAALATLVWTLCDKRREYVRLHRWFLVYMRLTLACALIPYGAIKVFPLQFPPAWPSQLIQPLLSFTPERMLWLSMGTSASYTFFCGLMELGAGLLLTVPRLATVGALLSIADMTNVLMLNLGYNLKVKLTSLNLLLAGLVILLPQVRSLSCFFVLNRSTPPAVDAPLFNRRLLNRTAAVLQIAFGIVLLSYNLYRSHQRAQEYAALQKTPLYGVWFVDDYVVNGWHVPPLSTDTHRWHRFLVDNKETASVQVMTGETNLLFLTSNPDSSRIILTQSGNPDWTAELSADLSDPKSLVLSGKMGQTPVVLRLHREDESKFPLLSREFSWVSEDDK